ncbi:hypothetical protein N7522_001032 [Penicillium canescens]|nr:hypothetical protein N7522_001032 [Penicillium canescens]
MSPDQQYWLPGYGLSRHIVLGHIHYFLGPTASVRPYSYQVCQVDTSAPLWVTCPNHISLVIKGREGYLINGVPLTREQIDDLATMSREYERQEAVRMAHNNGTATSSPGSDKSTYHTTHETFINEIIPINTPAPRRRDQDSRGR